jgi:hypothetical protein
MPEANFMSFPSNQVDEDPDYAPVAILKPKLLNRLCEVLRSRYSFVTNLLDAGYDTRRFGSFLAVRT